MSVPGTIAARIEEPDPLVATGALRSAAEPRGHHLPPRGVERSKSRERSQRLGGVDVWKTAQQAVADLDGGGYAATVAPHGGLQRARLFATHSLNAEFGIDARAAP